MKKIYNILLALLLMGAMGACNYLDVVPDETATVEDSFKNAKSAEKFLYSCYGSLPRLSATVSGLDFLTGDEVVTSFEHETFARFPKGTYTASDPVISYWNSLFTGIRYCYMLLDNIDKVPGMEKDKIEDYKAQAQFLIGFYHYLLIQNYGPTIIVTKVEDLNTDAKDFLPRRPLDECVKFVVDKFDAAAAKLPKERTGSEYGLVTSTAAKALKAKLYVIVASPLFNGNSKFYADFKSPDGTQLMPLTFDASKWTRAVQALREAIALAEADGFELYVAKEGALSSLPEPQDPIQRSLRFAILDRDNTKEIIWGDTRQQGWYDIAAKSAPYHGSDNAYSGVGVTLNMMKRFYTENGLPIDQDPEFFAESDWWNLMDVPSGYANAEGRIPNFLFKREPRLYAWVAFQNGYYEIENKDEKGNYARNLRRGQNGKKVVMKMLAGEPGGRGPVNNLRNNDYCPTLFLNKKLVSPAKRPGNNPQFIYPFISLADLYLLMAEASVETGDLTTAKTYLDKIRTRAGIPTVDEAWARAKEPGKANSQEGMREIVRQERMVEMYLQGQNFWDMRRWLLAETYFSQQPKGLNMKAATLEDMCQVMTVDVQRSFVSPRNYLMPIPQGEINKNRNLVQNVGY